MNPNYNRIWQAVKEVIKNGPIKQEIFLKRLEALRERIEIWCNKFGYNNQDNYAEHRDDKGRLIWHQTDWDYVDSMHNTVYNSHYHRKGEDGFGNDYSYNDKTLKKFNKLWKKYEI